MKKPTKPSDGMEWFALAMVAGMIFSAPGNVDNEQKCTEKAVRIINAAKESTGCR